MGCKHKCWKKGIFNGKGNSMHRIDAALYADEYVLKKQDLEVQACGFFAKCKLHNSGYARMD